MQVDGLYSGGAKAKPNTVSSAPLSPAKSGAGSPPDTVSANYVPANGLSQPSAPKNGSLVYGNVSLDLYTSRSESLTRQIELQGPDGYRGFRQELSRRFEAGLSLDFSFLAKVDGAAEKLSALDSSVMSDWMETASDLLNLKESDFEEFVVATDELFNEIEKVLGMGPEGLDYVADFFSQEVSAFLADVKTNMEYFDENPLGEGESMGLDIPMLGETARSAVAQDLQDFVNKILDEINANLIGQDGSKNSLFKALDELFREIMERYLDKNNKELNSSEIEALDGAEEITEPNQTPANAPLNMVA